MLNQLTAFTMITVKSKNLQTIKYGTQNKMLDRINKLPKYKFFDVLNELFENEKKDYYEKIFL